ncbi:MAG: site-specific integrase [Chitinophagales bacterium]
MEILSVNQKGTASTFVRNESDEAIFARYLAESDFKEGTKRVYRAGLRGLYSWMLANNYTLEKISRIEVISYKNGLQGTKLSHKSKTAYFQALLCFFKWYGAEFNGGKNIAAGVSGFDNIVDFQKDALTDDEFKKILKASLAKDTFVRYRNFAIIWILGTTGMRGSLSARNLKWSDLVRRECIDDKGNVSLRDFIRYTKKGKGFKEDYVPINDSTYLKLMAWYKQVEHWYGRVEQDWPIFYSLRFDLAKKHQEPAHLSDSGFRDLVRGMMKDAGVWSKTKSMHSIRHYFATMILRQTNGDKEFVRGLLGHSSTKVTDTYTRQADRFLAASKIQDIKFAE